MRNLITCLSVCVLSGATFAETWTVDDDGKADFDNIQAAVNAASNGDEILVMPGTYTSTANRVVNMLGKQIWLHSSKGEEVTIIDGEGARRGIVCDSGETSKTIIAGFTITNGYFPNANGGGSGGGMYNINSSSPTLTNCTFTNNSADNGGGIFNTDYSSPTLENCTFTNNSANYAGGGMNSYWDSSPTLENCTFTYNTAIYGGGMYNDGGNGIILTNCTFTNNTADTGGGMYSGGGGPVLTNCTLCSNTPSQISGAWSDEGGNTVTAICPVPGACCTNDHCLVSEQENCLAFFGVWQGEGTTCADNPCPTSCLGDITGDGVVDVSDLLVVIGVWGTCP